MKTANLHTFHLISPEVKDIAKKVQLRQIESRPWALQRTIDQGRASPLTSPTWGSNIQLVIFRRNVNQKPLKVCYEVLLSKIFQRESCSSIKCLLNSINILARDDPVPIKFGPKGTDLQYEGCMFHIISSYHIMYVNL